MKKNKPTKSNPAPKAEDVIAELTADLQRLQAEFINFKRRSESEKLCAIQTGKEQALIAILPVLDNIERAVAHEPADIKEHQWVKGVSAIACQLEGQMEAIGLKKIGAIGEEFEPSKHEAIVLDDGEGDIEVVSGVIQAGYMFGEDVIRPAIVKVAKNNYLS